MRSSSVRCGGCVQQIAYSERRRYFQGGELDSVMNYPLRDAILGFLNGGTAEHSRRAWSAFAKTTRGTCSTT